MPAEISRERQAASSLILWQTVTLQWSKILTQVHLGYLDAKVNAEFSGKFSSL